VLKPGVAFSLSLWLGLGLSACSLAGPSEHSFTPPVFEKPKHDADANVTSMQHMKADADNCRSQAKMKGVSTVLAIIRSADQRNTDQAYIACMQKKGYKLKGDEMVPATAQPH
jgi:hypothetical protein